MGGVFGWTGRERVELAHLVRARAGLVLRALGPEPVVQRAALEVGARVQQDVRVADVELAVGDRGHRHGFQVFDAPDLEAGAGDVAPFLRGGHHESTNRVE